tara:strand:- start:64 stop:357 length:294 start_codon:yes stop_codon:yes gene_type:complete
MEQEYTFQNYAMDVQTRITELSDQEKQSLEALAATPAAEVLVKILGEDLLSALPAVTTGVQSNMPTQAVPSTNMATPTPAAAPVAAERTGLAARPMQ